MTNPFNETLIILMLTMVIGMLFDQLIAHTVWSITIQHNPDNYARGLRHITWLETIRDLLTGDKLQWRHG